VKCIDYRRAPKEEARIRIRRGEIEGGKRKEGEGDERERERVGQAKWEGRTEEREREIPAFIMVSVVISVSE